jgi:DNA polymerase-3 subunit delta
MVAYAGELDCDEFLSTAFSFPFLSDHRVIIVKELEKLRSGWKRLIAYCEKPAPSSVVIFLCNPFEEGRARSRPPRDFKNLEAAVRRTGKVIEFERLSNTDLRAWIRKEAKRAGVELESDTAEALVQSVGENLFDIQNEIAKLSLLYAGRPVRVADLASVIGSYRLNAVFDLIENIEPGGEERSLRILQRIITSGAERPSGILYHLTRHFLGLLKMKAGVRSGVYRYERLQRKATTFDTRNIIVWLENLRRAELLLKTSSFPEEIILIGAFLHAFNGSIMESPQVAA